MIRIFFFFLFCTSLVAAFSSSKRVEAYLESNWQRTPFLLEASEFFAERNNNDFWKFVEAVGVVSIEHESLKFNRSLDISRPLLSPSENGLLRILLATHFYSPTVTLHQQLAKEATRDSHSEEGCSSFVIFGEKLICDHKDIEANIKAIQNKNQNYLRIPNEHIFPASGKEEDKPIAILYSQIGTEEFLEFHQILKGLANNGRIQYIFRHHFPQSKETISLQGYGVELALKSMEYKVVDDTVPSDGEKQQHVEVIEEEDIEGFLFHKLIARKPNLRAELLTFKDLLSQTDDLSIDNMKRWELKDIGFLSSQRIIQASDPLRLLRDISQNFPNMGASIAQTQLDPLIEQQLSENQGVYYGAGQSFAVINGKLIEPENIDFYKFINIIKSELFKATTLQSLKLSHNTIKQVLSLPSQQGKPSVRFDVRSNAITFINNLESDMRYASFPPSVNSILKGPVHGQFRFVRKNLITSVFILNPSDLAQLEVLDIIQQYLRRFIPIRFGFAFLCEDQLSCDFIKVFKHLSNVDPELALTFASQFRETVANTLPIEEAFALILTEVLANFDINNPNEITENPDLIKFVEESNLYVREMGLSSTNLPVAFVNGQYEESLDDAPQTIVEKVMNSAVRETQFVTNLVKKRQIDDSIDVLDYLFKQSYSVPGYNAHAFPSDPSFVSLCPTENSGSDLLTTQFLKTLTYIQNPEYEDRVKAITHFLVADFTTQKGFELLQAAFNSIQDTASETSSVSRIALVHHSDHPALYIKAIAAANKQISKKKFGFTKSLIEALSTSTSTSESYDLDLNTITSLAETSGFSKSFDQTLENIDLQKQSEWVHLILDLPLESTAIVTNGRVNVLEEDQNISSNFFSFITSLEMRSIIGQIAEVIESSSLVGVDADDLTSDFFSNIIMASTSLTVPSSDQYVILPSLKSSFEIENEDSFLDITFIVDPLSKAAQRFTPIIMELEKVVPIKLKVVLNPIPGLSDIPLKNYYRYILTSSENIVHKASFSSLPNKKLLTLGLDTPESWLVQPVEALHDLDNILLGDIKESTLFAKYQLEHILVQGRCSDPSPRSDSPRGLQLVLSERGDPSHFQDTIVMLNLGYFQLKANPGLWELSIAPGRHKQIYQIADGEEHQNVMITSFTGTFTDLEVTKCPGMQDQELLPRDQKNGKTMWNTISNWMDGTKPTSPPTQNETIHIFSVASGRLYERFLKIMILSVMKRTTGPVKFWFLQNVLSPDFKEFVPRMAKKYGFEVELVTYQWPYWLNKQKEKQRMIWGYKILFLDVLFPLNVTKIIFVDADLVVRGDLRELWNLDLKGAPLAYTPFCDSNTETEGFRFWKRGFWKDHLQGRPYHISALYVVDLAQFRMMAAGDHIRATYEMLSHDANSLANLDQDLPNYLQHQVPIFSLPQEWLWCETWCHNSSKNTAKAIDLCNNPLTKTPKLDNALRIIEEWPQLDAEAKKLQDSELLPQTPPQQKDIGKERYLDREAIL